MSPGTLAFSNRVQLSPKPFDSLSIGPTLVDDDIYLDDGTIAISVDDLPIDIVAARLGLSSEEGIQELVWEIVEGQGEITDGPKQSDKGDGIWFTTLETEPVAGNEIVVKASLAGVVCLKVKRHRLKMVLPRP